MDEINLLELIKRRFAALLANVHPRADPKLAAEVPATLAQTDSDLPAVFMRARRVLEIIVLDIYRRELPAAKPKPLADMIEALYAQQGLVSKRVAADLHYIRVNGNLIIHPQDEAVEIRPGDAEPVLLIFLSIVEWYLTVYLPERLGEAPARAPTLPPPPNPYRGLLAFREADAGNYFGREPDAADLLAACERQPLVAVVGPSGSGKSSLVYAGVVPPLRATDGTRIADFRPRGRPFAELAQALVALWPIDPTDRLAQARKLAAHLAEGQVTLTDAVQETLRQSGGSRLLLIADQFEELYTLGQPNEEAQGFMDLLAQTVQDGLAIPNRAGPPDLCLLLTLRVDFLGQALAHPGLAALLDRCPPKLLGPVEDRTRLRAIIEQPARGVGVALEELLPERILRDLAQLPGTQEQVGGASLPLLEFTLAQLWDQQEERRLTHRGYEALGGIQQSLSRHADGVLARLDPADQARMRHVLVQMVRPGEGTEDTRQVATRDQLHPDDWPLVVRLADADTRLVVTGHDGTTDQDTAEIVHETLIRHWQPLRDWIDADRAFRLWQNGLRQAMAEWTRTGQDDGALLAGARLGEAEERLTDERERMGEAEVAFIAAGLVRRDTEAAERERNRREWERLQRRLSFGLAAFLAVALVLTALAAWQWRVAEDQGEQLAASLEQESHAKALAEGQRSQAQEQTRIAMEARRRADDQAFLSSKHLAKAHEEKAIGILGHPSGDLSTRDYQAALLHVLQAQRQPIRGAPGITPTTLSLIDRAPMELAFEQRWRAPNANHLGIQSMALSPDDSILATASGNRVRLWNVDSGESFSVLTSQENPVSAVAFSPDDRLLATASGSSSHDGHHPLRVWDVATGQVRQTLVGHQKLIDAISFSPDGHLIASAARDNSVRLWEVSTGKTIRTLTGHQSSVSAVTFHPDGHLLASASWDKTVRLWDSATGELLRILAEHQESVNAVSFSPDGKLLASASGFYGVSASPLDIEDNSVRIWNTATGDLLRTFAAHSGMVTDVAFSPDGRVLATASEDSTVRLWDVATGETVRLLISSHGDPQGFDSIIYSSDGNFLIAKSFNYIEFWDVSTGIAQRPALADVSQPKAVAFSPDARVIASAQAHSIHLWDPQSGALIRTISSPNSILENLAFSNDGAYVAAGSEDGSIRIWDGSTGNDLHRLAGYGPPNAAIAFSPDGHALASASRGVYIDLWDPDTGDLLSTLEADDWVNALAFSLDGRLLAAATGNEFSKSGLVQVWDTTTWDVIYSLAGHPDLVTAVAFRPDGNLLASGSGRREFGSDVVVLWNLNDGSIKHTLKGHIGPISSLSFSADGRQLASGSLDRTVRIWDTEKGFLKHTAFNLGYQVRSVSFSPLGEQLAIAGDSLSIINVGNNKSSPEQTALLSWSRLCPAIHCDDKKSVTVLNGAPFPNKILAASPDGKLVGSPGLIIDRKKGVILHTLDDNPGVPPTCFSPDGQLIAGQGNNSAVGLWNPLSGVLMRTLEGHTQAVTSCAFPPDGKTLATGSWDGTIRLWDLAKGAELRSLKGHQGRISDLSFSPDGNFLASSSSIDGSVRVWDPATGLNTCEMKLDQQDVNSVVFSPDGALLVATLGSDMSQFVRLPPIQLLNHNNCTTVRSLGNLKPFSKPALFATFSADGSHLASVSNDGDLHLWSISLVKLLRSTRAPSPRAALISETLQRLWGLRMEGLTVVRDNWNDLFPRGGYYTNQLVTVDTRTVEEAADPNTPPILRTFDIRPLLDPPTPDKDKLDQLLDWLAEQERLEPRLRAQ